MRFVSLCLVMILTLACRKTPVQPSDPCADLKPFSLEIIVDEFAGDSLTIDTDSIIINTFVTFRANYPIGYFPKLTWKLGDIERTEREFPLAFRRPNVSVGAEVPVELTAEIPANPCFPGGKTVFRATRNLRVINMKDAKIIGRYRGIFGRDISKRDTQTVEVRYIPPDNVFEDGLTAVFNVQMGCNAFASNGSDKYWYMVETLAAMGNNYRIFGTNAYYNGCLGPIAYLRLKPGDRDSLIVDYSFTESVNVVNPRIQDQFRGKRLQ